MTNKTLTSPVITTPTVTGLTLNDSSIVFEGSSADANETTLTVVDPTADRTITLPNVDGTVITTGNLSSITSTGTLTSLTVSGDIVLSGTNAPGSIIDELTLLLMGAL
jgi:hypothetical protein